MKDQHPYKPFVPEGAKKCIIGTIPPHRFCAGSGYYADDVLFYYGSRDNHFWKLIAEIFSCPLHFNTSEKAVRERKEFLASQNIAVTDIIERCGRKQNGSSDVDLFSIEYKDLGALLNNYPLITELIYTSEFVKKCINEAFNTHHESVSTNKKRKSVVIYDKKYTVHILYSPSPNGLRSLGTRGKEIRRLQYEQVFLNRQ
jgi:G:T/U-mismatch repair DNA glycosylase